MSYEFPSSIIHQPSIYFVNANLDTNLNTGASLNSEF